MKNHFTITITDVHGAKSFSFNQFIRKFVWYLALLLLLVLFSGSAVIWWLTEQAQAVELKSVQVELKHREALTQKQLQYMALDDAKRQLEQELDDKSKEIQFLDQTLQGLEELVGVQTTENQPVQDRVAIAQLTSLEKKIMLSELPNGRPVEDYQGVSSGYGWRTHPVTGKKDFHRAIDYRGKVGDVVIATADAVVEYAGFHKTSGYGNLIILDHVYGFKTLYGHMSEVTVKAGDVVTKGQPIGLIGSTGVSSGPHLHYEVSFIQRKLNPADFVNWDLKNYSPIFNKVKEVPWGSLTQKVQERVKRVEKQLSLRDVESAVN
ncbi:M23 family metallopeptidase [Thiosulfativibrio zosterae]|uniref:Peptidase n=1 Tax=Thiosulfativibrio zosterae TaxID=2675053 RepID=A0A6F8PPB0_9GAMM|nr:peptidoglycan DD-metalloendopeptidase family protein [Thiosulfativibrio zosterae]BBP43961.1 peptidase [Thiosulfativibrio zosterae]